MIFSRTLTLLSVYFLVPSFSSQTAGVNRVTSTRFLRGLQIGNETASNTDDVICVDLETFKRFSQRYFIMDMFHQAGVFPLAYQTNLLDFKEEFDECKWYGIQCESGVVTGILLRDSGLINLPFMNPSKPFPSEDIYILEDLEVLDLSKNEVLLGTLPKSISKMPHLRIMDFSFTGVSGNISCYDTGIGITNTPRFVSHGGHDEGSFFDAGEISCLCDTDRCFNNEPSEIIDDSPFNRRAELIPITQPKCIDKIAWYKFSQRFALAEFFYHVGVVPSTKYASQTTQYGGIDALFNPDECTWLGVTCNSDGLVTAINLHNEGLSSNRVEDENFEIDSEDIVTNALSSLVKLEILNLSNNPDLVGTLPCDLDKLMDLSYLDISGTGLSGEVACNQGGMSKFVRHSSHVVDDVVDEGEGYILRSIVCACEADYCISN